MATYSFNLAYLFSITSLICFTHLLLSLVIQADTEIGFSVDLMHRDSQLSPFYNPSETYIDRLHNAYLRSISRINHFKTRLSASTRAFRSPMVHSGAEYFIEISIGTPNIKVLAVADTGSDLIWVQCIPCENCYKQNLQIFNPENSSTFQLLSCKSPNCGYLETEKLCDKKRNVCGYNYSYADSSFTAGDLGKETLTFPSGNPVSFSNITFGCGHNNVGLFDEAGSGIIGIGGGPLSLISQLHSSIKGKFSYCMVPQFFGDVGSKINFGTTSLVTGHDVVSTPLVNKEPATFYFVTLEAISVGNSRLVYTNGSSSIVEKGNMMIDSGTTYTFLDPLFYELFTGALEEAFGSESIKRPKIPSFCFQIASNYSDLPIITFHFTGADVKLPFFSSYIIVQKDMVCLTMIPVNDLAILGNLSQRNMVVGYDLEKKVVSFKPTDCTKFAQQVFDVI